MANFEHVGKRIDEELEKLRRFYESEVKPTTKKRLAEALRAASSRLGKLARQVERGRAARSRARKQRS